MTITQFAFAFLFLIMFSAAIAGMHFEYQKYVENKKVKKEDKEDTKQQE